MNDFDKKIHDAFPSLVVRKDLVKEVKGNAIVPSYVLEYLLGQYCATDDQETVKAGIGNVKAILAEHYVHRNEANKIRAEISERGQKKVIDMISVTFNEKRDTYEASFSNLGISRVLVDSDTIKKHQKLLVNGVWCIATVSYQLDEDAKDSSPWHIENLKPIQLSNFDFDTFLEGRKQFSSEEWVDVLMQSIGFNPEMFSKRLKLLHLLRLVPFVERNYNLIELGPKGTGKSHIYSEMSPYGMLLSGGEVTVAKLFVNNNRNQLGLVGFWDVVAFDEFAGQAKKVDKALVDIMKNYMANKSFSRGIETMHAEASMAFVGNTKHTVPYMLKNSDLFEELPSAYHDSAFIDRIHAFVPGWEFDSIRFDMFSDGHGFIVDYLAEMLRYMRNRDYSNMYQDYFTLSSDITTRDKDGINKTFSGLMKLIYPNGVATKEEIKEILEYNNLERIISFLYEVLQNVKIIHHKQECEQRKYDKILHRLGISFRRIIHRFVLRKDERLIRITECLDKHHHDDSYFKTSSVNSKLLFGYLPIVKKHWEKNLIGGLIKNSGYSQNQQRERIRKHTFQQHLVRLCPETWLHVWQQQNKCQQSGKHIRDKNIPNIIRRVIKPIN